MRFLFHMELTNYLVVRMGRVTRDYVASLAVQDEHILRELMHLIQAGNQTQRMKGSWVLSGVRMLNPEVLKSYYPVLITCLKNEKVGGVKREILRSFEGGSMSDALQEELIVITIGWVTDEHQDLAVRYVCYRLLGPLLKRYPELQMELRQQVDLYRMKFGKFP
jgi:hypothetical protein